MSLHVTCLQLPFPRLKLHKKRSISTVVLFSQGQFPSYVSPTPDKADTKGIVDRDRDVPPVLVML